MPKAPMKNSKSTRMAQWVIAQPQGANTAEVAMQFKIGYKLADDLLRQRANGYHDIRRQRGRWIACSEETRALLARQALQGSAALKIPEAGTSIDEVGPRPSRSKSGSGVIAGLRQAPDINAVWKGHTTPGPIRPGAMDFMAIPSRHGDTRHPYTTGGPQIAGTASESPTRASLSHRNGPRPTV